MFTPEINNMPESAIYKKEKSEDFNVSESASGESTNIGIKFMINGDSLSFSLPDTADDFVSSGLNAIELVKKHIIEHTYFTKKGFRASHFKEMGFRASHFKEMMFTVEDFKEMKFISQDFFNFKFKVEQFKEMGFTAKDFMDFQFYPLNFDDVGFCKKDFLEKFCFQLDDFKKLHFTGSDFCELFNFDKFELKKIGFDNKQYVAFKFRPSDFFYLDFKTIDFDGFGIDDYIGLCFTADTLKYFGIIVPQDISLDQLLHLDFRDQDFSHHSYLGFTNDTKKTKYLELRKNYQLNLKNYLLYKQETAMTEYGQRDDTHRFTPEEEIKWKEAVLNRIDQSNFLRFINMGGLLNLLIDHRVSNGNLDLPSFGSAISILGTRAKMIGASVEELRKTSFHELPICIVPLRVDDSKLKNYSLKYGSIMLTLKKAILKKRTAILYGSIDGNAELFTPSFIENLMPICMDKNKVLQLKELITVSTQLPHDALADFYEGIVFDGIILDDIEKITFFDMKPSQKVIILLERVGFNKSEALENVYELTKR